MKNILLICAAGMSTSLMVNKMNAAAKELNVEVNIQALAVSECESVLDKMDIVLLGPQVRYQKGKVESLVNGRIPVDVMDMRNYGTLNGKAILEKALQMMK